MNLLAPIARPGFNWNHDKLMTDYGRGLAGASGGELMNVLQLDAEAWRSRLLRVPALEG